MVVDLAYDPNFQGQTEGQGHHHRVGERENHPLPSFNAVAIVALNTSSR